VRRFLADAGPEPLSGRRKALTLSRSEVRLQACGASRTATMAGSSSSVSQETNVVWTLDGLALSEATQRHGSARLSGNGGVNPTGWARHASVSRRGRPVGRGRLDPPRFGRRPATPADGVRAGVWPNDPGREPLRLARSSSVAISSHCRLYARRTRSERSRNCCGLFRAKTTGDMHIQLRPRLACSRSIRLISARVRRRQCEL